VARISLGRAAMNRRFGLALGLSLATACAPTSEEPDFDEEIASSEDELSEPGFDRNRVLSDAAFTDWEAMSEAEIQAFLENTPYGGKSVLANLSSGGMKASKAIAKAATEHRVNPLLILTRAQMEQSLIGKSTASQKAKDFAFGCGCPDYQSCSETWRGFHKQVDCMASHMREYLDDLEGGGATIAGWRVGQAKKALDGWVTPKNAATAALYTYTPWIGKSGFGNLGHHQIWKRFAGHVGYAPIGPGGCPAETFPSGRVAQSLPSDAMTEAYATLLTPLGLEEAPKCFLDPMQLVNPSTETAWAASSKVATNFSFSELVEGEPGARAVLVEPELVTKLQAIRTKVKTSVSVEDAYRSPERQVEECGAISSAACSATLAMSLGRAAIVDSSVGETALLDAAKSVGVATCWAEGAGVFVDVTSPGLGCPIAKP
jgi:hypothetical protein